MNTEDCIASDLNIASGTIDLSTSDQRSKPLQLSQEQINQFNDQGYFIVKKLFDMNEVTRVKELAEQLLNETQQLFDTYDDLSKPIMHKGTQFVLSKTDTGTQIKRIVWVGAIEPEFLKLARQPKLSGLVAQLLNSDEADQLINQLHYKLPHDAVAFPWHQDLQHRRNYDQKWCDINGKGSFVQTLVAIDPMTEANGTIYVLPYSVSLGDLHFDDIDDSQELESTIKKLEKQTGHQLVPLVCEPGDTIFMHPLLVHGSAPNTSEISRLVFINGFSYPGANHESYPGEGSACRIKLQ